MGSQRTPRISHHLISHAMKQSSHQFYKTFLISQNVWQAMQKNITVEDNKKE